MADPKWYTKGKVLCRGCRITMRPEECKRGKTGKLLCPNCSYKVAERPRPILSRLGSTRRIEREESRVV